MKPLIALLLLAAAITPALAADDPALPALRQKMAKEFGVAPEDITASPIPGLYQVYRKHKFGYVSADGNYVINGDLVNLKTGERITEEHRRADRLAAIQQLGDQNMIEFAPQPPVPTKYVVTVFTDVDCGFCRKLHSEMAQYNAHGIKIRYAFWPRTGPDTPSWYRAEAVWCASDRQGALTQAKQGMEFPLKKQYCDNPVRKEYDLGSELGVDSTPTMIMPDGEFIAGYVPPDVLAAHLALTAAADQDTSTD